MLDLKAKLASAGLVSQEDIDRANAKGSKGKKKPAGPRVQPTAGLAVAKLKDKPKGEVYEAIRRWVDKVRLDPAVGTPSEQAEAFHFPSMTGKIGRLVVEPEVRKLLQSGEAGLIAYMSNHGLAHAVVPAAGARAVAEIYPLWLRFLDGDPRAGQIQPKEPPKDPAPREG